MRTCPRCGEENAERARFCSNCGEPLGEPEQRRRERKYATALFADIVGSTALAESEDPEVVQAVVGRAFDRLTEEITRYEGVTEKFMGDAVRSSLASKPAPTTSLHSMATGAGIAGRGFLPRFLHPPPP